MPAVVVYSFLLNRMVIVSPASALPQTGMALPRCITMPDWKSWGIVIFASAVDRQNSVAQKNNNFFIIVALTLQK